MREPGQRLADRPAIVFNVLSIKYDTLESTGSQSQVEGTYGPDSFDGSGSYVIAKGRSRLVVLIMDGSVSVLCNACLAPWEALGEKEQVAIPLGFGIIQLSFAIIGA